MLVVTVITFVEFVNVANVKCRQCIANVIVSVRNQNYLKVQDTRMILLHKVTNDGNANCNATGNANNASNRNGNDSTISSGVDALLNGNLQVPPHDSAFQPNYNER